MRTHPQIIKDAGGPAAFHAKLGYEGKYETVNSWLKREKIPPAAWTDVVRAGLSTFDELSGLAAEEQPRDIQPAA